MTRAPNWSIEEFDTVLNNSNLDSLELAQQLPRRTPGAIEVVRQGIHSFHTGGDLSLLSKMMLRRLKEKQEQVTCAVCGVSF
jgi:hypothetical protein